MLVRYKIPGWEPVREIPAAGIAPASPFPLRSPNRTTLTPVGWRSLLRLDQPRSGAVVAGPPPRPPGLGETSAPAEARVMRGILSRHGHEADPSRAGTPEAAAIREMVLLLLDMQASQDALAVRCLEQEAH
ncbi:MAG: hypothetical protein R2762_28915 [Bryobacteraceae bacterium]